MLQNYCGDYLLDMDEWITYLDIKNKYQSEEIKKKCLLFIFLRLRYNEFYNLRISDNIGDKAKAIKLADDETCQQKYNELKENFLEKFKQIEGADTPRTWIKDIKNNEKIYYNNTHNSLKYFLTIIYIIRCNIFHGDKPPMDSNIKIIAWAYDCFDELLNACDYWNS
mgnify:CR=1 FL=1